MPASTLVRNHITARFGEISHSFCKRRQEEAMITFRIGAVRQFMGKRHMSALSVKSKGELCSITLTRPRPSIALNPEITNGVKSQLMEWKQGGSSPCVFVVKGEGKTFCAEWDVKAIWEELNEGKIPKEDIGTGKPGYLHTDFFRTEYHMNYLAGASGVPQVGFWDGFVMGGSVGIGILGKYRIATENTVFAMPETAIGLFPDVGSSYWLPSCAWWSGVLLGPHWFAHLREGLAAQEWQRTTSAAISLKLWKRLWKT